jgi:saccharopine dehydrogenase (NAD+, L-lysine forming)
MKPIKLGILRENKIPPDNRVPFNPNQCSLLKSIYPELEIYVQPSAHRCFTDKEYLDHNIVIREDVTDCQILMGVKEVPPQNLIADKTYLFFSHTMKKQPHNKKLLQTVLKKNIRLIDYEALTWETGERILGFGHYAGVVGAHNGLLFFGKRTHSFELKRAFECDDFHQLTALYDKIKLPPVKIVVTGTGRVAKGVFELLDAIGIKMISPEDFLQKKYNEPVYCVLNSEQLYERKLDGGFDRKEFHARPELYQSKFHPYAAMTDLMINAIYWDVRTQRFFSKDDMAKPSFHIQVIADVTCDVDGSVPCTIRESTIPDAVYGFDPKTQMETKPFQQDCIDVMAVSNLPNELPREASTEFGNNLMQFVTDELFSDFSVIIERASVAKNGKLTARFSYLEDYAK